MLLPKDQGFVHPIASEITPRAVFEARRSWTRQMAALAAGLVAPGLPNAVIALGEKFGRIVNYGDGLYGGQFIGATYAEAFFETDPVRESLPPDCAASRREASTRRPCAMWFGGTRRIRGTGRRPGSW